MSSPQYAQKMYEHMMFFLIGPFFGDCSPFCTWVKQLLGYRRLCEEWTKQGHMVQHRNNLLQYLPCRFPRNHAISTVHGLEFATVSHQLSPKFLGFCRGLPQLLSDTGSVDSPRHDVQMRVPCVQKAKEQLEVTIDHHRALNWADFRLWCWSLWFYFSVLYASSIQ